MQASVTSFIAVQENLHPRWGDTRTGPEQAGLHAGGPNGVKRLKDPAGRRPPTNTCRGRGIRVFLFDYR